MINPSGLNGRDRDRESVSLQIDPPTEPETGQLYRSYRSRTADGSRMFRDNFRSVLDEIRPLVEQARSANSLSLTSLISRPVQPAQPAEESRPLHSHASAEAEELATGHDHSYAAEQDSPLLNMLLARPYNSHEDQPQPQQSQPNVPSDEARPFLNAIQKYVAFALILLAKCLFDNLSSIRNFVVLMAAFAHSNSVVVREAAKKSRKSYLALFMEVLYIAACIFFIYYDLSERKLYLALVFIPLYKEPFTVLDLLSTVFVTDVVLKLITILLKIAIVALPEKLRSYHNRGKLFLLVEAISQLYRSMMPIHFWLYYLLESYHGPEKVVGVFLSSAYMVAKSADLMSRLRLFERAVVKYMQKVNLGSSPNKDQIQTAGSQCPICHDDYNAPVLLECRHIFCESCVSTWFDREQTCPLCRAKIADDPSFRDGSTTYFPQMF